MNYYIADTHFGHDNIRRLSKRPFDTAEEMDEAMIASWNGRVRGDDDVYILGDFAYKSRDPAYYLDRLKGRKHLIAGNHDGKLLKNPILRSRFAEIADMETVNDGGTKIVCCHYPMAEWDGYYKGVLHFYGHLHNNDNAASRYMSGLENAYNVGVDIIGFAPRTLKEIKGT